ncbi:hypothetical protein QTN93_00490 [Sphingomonas aerolata]|uniref:LexA family protein n=1 Tax=Sphingomonas aerolata TaxID=185951 RepID=UPI0035A72C2D
MGATTRSPEVVPRRDQALAFIIERIARSGTSPTFEEIGVRLNVSSTRAKELVAQLIERNLVEKTPGAQRSLRVRDVAGSRALLDETMRRLGWAVAQPMGSLCQPPPSRKGSYR